MMPTKKNDTKNWFPIIIITILKQSKYKTLTKAVCMLLAGSGLLSEESGLESVKNAGQIWHRLCDY